MIGTILAVVLSSSVISVPKGDLYDEDPVVTNVDLSGIGEARSLPKYLHERSFDDSYPDAAEAYYRSRGNGKANGGCSSTYGGGFLRRNFDYPFDDRAEFVVRMSAGTGRFASVGVAQVGTNLTERFVTSGEPSVWYKALPGATVDGINENGVACNINVSDDEPSWGTDPVDEPLHPLAVIRWILDHATNAQSAAEYVAGHVRFPQGWVQNFHYMVADADGAYIVENGEALPAGEYHEPDEPATMTNFPLNRFPWGGMGMERFGLLLGGANITNAWYTRAYRRETVPQWKSEFSADVLVRTNEIFDAWAEHPKEYFRGKTNNGEPWWQTVHTSVYDITNRILRLAVQETDDWYVFQVPSVGRVKSVNGMTGDVTLSVPDIPGDIPLARVKNESGNAVGARDVGAFPATLSRFGSNYESTWPIFITPTAKLQGWTIQAGLNLGLNVKKYNEAMTDVFTLNILPDFMQLQRGPLGTPYNVYFPTNAGTLALTSEIESATAGVLRRSDIYDWALQPTKPTYDIDETGARVYVDSATGRVYRTMNAKFNTLPKKVSTSNIMNENGAPLVKLMAEGETTNYGDTWTNSNITAGNWDGLCIMPSGKAVALKASNGTPAGGTYWSNDGRTWTRVAPSGTSQFAPPISCVTPSGRIVGGYETSNWAYYSDDDGLTWTTVRNIPGMTAFDVMVATPSGRVIAGCGYDTFHSDDGGATWVKGTSIGGYGSGGGLYVSPSGRIFAGCNGIYYSDDDGDSWTHTSAPNMACPCFCVATNGYVVAGTFTTGADKQGIWYSTDGGDTWLRSSAQNGYWNFLVCTRTGRLLAGSSGYTPGGIWQSDDCGRTWTETSNTTWMNCEFAGTMPNGLVIISSLGQGLGYMDAKYPIVGLVQGVTVNGVRIEPDSDNIIDITVGGSSAPKYHDATLGVSWTNVVDNGRVFLVIAPDPAP